MIFPFASSIVFCFGIFVSIAVIVPYTICHILLLLDFFQALCIICIHSRGGFVGKAINTVHFNIIMIKKNEHRFMLTIFIFNCIYMYYCMYVYYMYKRIRYFFIVDDHRINIELHVWFVLAALEFSGVGDARRRCSSTASKGRN